MFRTLTAVAACLVLAVTGCTAAVDQPRPAPTPTPTGPPIYQGPELPRLVTEEVPVDPRVWVREAYGPVVRTGTETVVVRGGGAEGGAGFSVLDLRTGRQLWSSADLPERVEVPGIGRVVASSSEVRAADDGGGGILVASYYQNPCPDKAQPCPDNRPGMTEGKGLLAFSVADRRLLWSAPLLPPVPGNTPVAEENRWRFPKVVAATAKAVVVNIGADPGDGTRYLPGRPPPMTLALDPVSGRRLWEVQGVLTQQVVDDLALGIAAPTDSANPPVPVALDLGTGTERWRLPAAEAGDWVEVTPGLGLLRRRDFSTNRATTPRLVSLPGGEVGPELPQDENFVGLGSGSDGIPYATWIESVPGSREYALLSQGFRDAQPRTGPTRLGGHGSVLGVARGYAWRTLGAPENGVTAIDRTGSVRSDPLPGFPRYVDDELLVTGGPGGPPRIWRHRPG
ncbi:hypothetical protein BI335_00035 [Enemella evansiae]|uniref:hypothetical protein n=1 Tax=Enemella evansiae TaxID=2016499 RepID=UPI000B95F3DA|nr:hypothetical protein [Enemella evansiae]OYO20006.1 hypothetical protein BI335_00035 [Enemella evansiae]